MIFYRLDTVVPSILREQGQSDLTSDNFMLEIKGRRRDSCNRILKFSLVSKWWLLEVEHSRKDMVKNNFFWKKSNFFTWLTLDTLKSHFWGLFNISKDNFVWNCHKKWILKIWWFWLKSHLHNIVSIYWNLSDNFCSHFQIPQQKLSYHFQFHLNRTIFSRLNWLFKKIVIITCAPP